jgi:hypothetical protein
LFVGVIAVGSQEDMMDEKDKGAEAERLNKEMKESVQNQDLKNVKFAKGKGLRVIMIGNSWTRPAIRTLPEIAKAAGMKDHKTIQYTVGSSAGHPDPLFHDKGCRNLLDPAIKTGQWDVMTMLSRLNDKPEFFIQWMDLCLKANPKMVFYIQQGWTYYSKPKSVTDVKTELEWLEKAEASRQAEYKSYAEGINKKYPGKMRFIPCGAAVTEMVRLYYDNKLPGFDCVIQTKEGSKGIYKDGSHVSDDTGMDYLSGYVFYGVLYRRSPEHIKGYKPAKLSAEIDGIMRKVAWKAIISTPLSGITDKNGDGLAD